MFRIIMLELHLGKFVKSYVGMYVHRLSDTLVEHNVKILIV